MKTIDDVVVGSRFEDSESGGEDVDADAPATGHRWQPAGMKSPESSGSARGRDSARGVSKRRGQRRRAMPVEEADKADGLAKQLEDVAFCESGSQLRRVKRGRLGEPRLVRLIEKKFFNYYSSYFFLSFLPNSLKSGESSSFSWYNIKSWFSVEIHELLECRSGYATDVFQKSAKKYEFQEKAPVSCQGLSGLPSLAPLPSTLARRPSTCRMTPRC